MPTARKAGQTEKPAAANKRSGEEQQTETEEDDGKARMISLEEVVD